MYRVITCNTNGIRAAARKGFFDWLAQQDADVVCIQEIKAKEVQLTDSVFYPEGYHCFYNEAERPGYSGTAVFCRQKPQKVTTRLDWELLDTEGRYIQVDFPGLSVVSLYVPSGSSSDAAQARKDGFMEPFYEHLKALRRKRREFIICADWNTCHQNIDLKNWRSNQRTRDSCPMSEHGWIAYTMSWAGSIFFARSRASPTSTRGGQIEGQAWANNVGWRLDYMLVTPGLSGSGLRQAIYRDERFSDHAPLTIDFDIPARA